MYVLSPEAAADLDSIDDYLFRQELNGKVHAGTAELVINRLRAKIKAVSDGLAIPHRRTEIDPKLWFVNSGDWMIALEANRQEVVSIFHGRDLKNIGES